MAEEYFKCASSLHVLRWIDKINHVIF